MIRSIIIALSLSLATPAFSFEIEMEKWFKEEPEAPKRKPQPQVRGWVAVKPKPRLTFEIGEEVRVLDGAFANVTEAIGRTPIIKLNKVAAHVKSDIYVKCEYLNPGGSMKDRVALNIIRDAERRGLLQPGGTIVEATSGNTGIALAMAAATDRNPRSASSARTSLPSRHCASRNRSKPWSFVSRIVSRKARRAKGRLPL